MFFICYPFPEIRDEVPENFSKPPNFLPQTVLPELEREPSGGLRSF